MKVIIRRFIEIFFVNVLLSATIAGLYELELLSGTQDAIKFAMLLSVIIYIAIQVRMMRHCFFDLCNRYNHYLFNLMAYFIFIVLSLLVFFFGGNVLFTWLFGITKFIFFINMDFDAFFSLIIFHLVMLLAIALAPLGMGWVFFMQMEANGEEELRPTLLDIDDHRMR